jgi:Protein of unknown function DUF262
MKNYDSRTYSLNDFLEWDRQRQLELNPFFQRRPVWSEKAKSYLMDTIIRGKPIPKFFIRQKINVSTKTSAREVVDGQQRIRTILSYLKDGFEISKSQNAEFGGKRFSQLPEETQASILSYEVSVDLLINLPDAEILDIFGRLNSYAVVLNDQEKINASHFGPFKVVADRIAFKYNEYWTRQKILTPQQILRMQEVSLVADLLVALQDGIQPKKQIKRFYTTYEKSYSFDPVNVEGLFDRTIEVIASLFPEGLAASEFRRVHVFYSIFTAVAHCLHGIPGIDVARIPLTSTAAVQNARNGLDRVSELFIEEDFEQLSRGERQFLEDCRRATTDGPVRERRTMYLLSLMS